MAEDVCLLRPWDHDLSLFCSPVPSQHPAFAWKHPNCGVSLLHRAMGVSTPHSLTTMEQGILMVGDSPQQINSDRYSLIRQEELADMRMVSTWAIAEGFWEGE